MRHRGGQGRGCQCPRTFPQLAAPFAVKSERRGQEYWITPCGELDLATAQTLEDDLVAIESSDAERIVLNLSSLVFMDSSGLHLLVRAHDRSLTNGKRLGLIAGSRAVQSTLRATGVEDRLPFIAPDAAARAATTG